MVQNIPLKNLQVFYRIINRCHRVTFCIQDDLEVGDNSKSGGIEKLLSLVILNNSVKPKYDGKLQSGTTSKTLLSVSLYHCHQ